MLAAPRNLIALDARAAVGYQPALPERCSRPGPLARMRVMRHLPALMLALLTATAGCGLFGGKRKPQTYDAQRPPVRGAAASAEVVYLDVAVLERPSGNRYLDQEVWESGDEQGV